MQLGAVEYLVKGADDGATFDRARRLGFAGVEVMLTRAQLTAPGRERLLSLKQAAERTSLAVPSLMLSEHNNGGLASADPAVAQAALEDVRLAVTWAADLGADVVLVPFFFRGEIVSDDDFERAVQGFRALCPIAAAHGVMLCYEGTLPAPAIVRLAQQVGSPAFGCYFDLANVVWRGLDTATELRTLGRLVSRVHMKESYIGPGDRSPGLGRVDYAESARALREIGYAGWVVLETPAGPDPLVARDISFTRRVLAGIAGAPAWPRFGVFSYGFRRGQLEQMIASLKQAGLVAVQLGSDLLDEAIEHPEAAVAIGQRLADAGIEVVALAGYRNLVAPDEDRRQANIAYLRRCLEVAPLLGTTIVATETGTRNSESDWAAAHENLSEGAWELLFAAIEQLLPVAEQHGSILAIEGYVNNVVQHPGHVLRLLERYPSKHLQLVLDPYNYVSGHLLPAQTRVVADFLRRFEHRFVLAHLKDVGANGAEMSTPEFGTGQFDQRPYLAFLREQRPDLPLILEHLDFDRVPAAIERVRAIARDGSPI